MPPLHLILCLVVVSTAAPLLHHIDVDGLLVCPDGVPPENVEVIVRDGQANKVIFRKEFHPADEFCMRAEDLVDSRVAHPLLVVEMKCRQGEEICTYRESSQIPIKFLDNPTPFRPRFRATEQHFISCTKKDIFTQTGEKQ